MSSAIIPIPKADVSVREGTADDMPFIDELQKVHRKQVGFMSRGQLEGKFKAREVLVAWASRPCSSSEDTGKMPVPHQRVGYVIGTDRYFKHDDVGIIYHLNVAPGKQRGFVGATLLRAMFDRAAYGCKLFSCWCAQDIEANRFWEAMGFVPLAYRAGSEKTLRRSSGQAARVHIFWQKRIRSGDTTTPWWFPSQTTGGAMNEPRLVFPIPPGTHWSDARPVILPKESLVLGHSSWVKNQGPRTRDKGPVRKPKAVSRGAMLFFTPPAPPKPACPERSRGEKKPKRKNDPRLVAAARELKDRWLEHLNNGGEELLPQGKYDVARVLPEVPVAPVLKQLPQLAA